MAIHFSGDSYGGFALLDFIVTFLLALLAGFFFIKKFKKRTGRSFREIIADLKRYNENQQSGGKQLTEFDEEELAKRVSERMENNGETLEQALKDEGAGEYAENKTILEITRLATENMAAEKRWKKEKHPLKYIPFIIFLAIFVYMSLSFFKIK